MVLWGKKLEIDESTYPVRNHWLQLVMLPEDRLKRAK